MSEPTKEQIEKLRWLAHPDLPWSADVRALLDAYEERGREIEAWESRFRALVDEDTPATAGNQVIHLQAEIERLRSETRDMYSDREAVAWRERAEQAEAEIERLRGDIETLYSEDPCPKCGHGITGQCYGCLLEQAKAEIERLNEECGHKQDRCLRLEQERNEVRAEVERLRAQITSLADFMQKRPWLGPFEGGAVDVAMSQIQAHEARLAKVIEKLEPIAGSTLAGPCREYILLARAALAAAQPEEPKPHAFQWAPADEHESHCCLCGKGLDQHAATPEGEK